MPAVGNTTVLYVANDRGATDRIVAGFVDGDPWSVVTADTPEEGLDRLAGASVDCVVSALGLEGSGLAFLRTVRREYPDLPFVAVLRGEDDAVVDVFVAHGVDDPASEPVERVVDRVRAAVRRGERRRDRERYRTLVEAVGDPMYILDTDGRITFANEAMAERLGRDRDSIVGTHVSEFMTEADVATGQSLLSDLLADEDRQWESFEMEVHTADGEVLEVEDKIAPLTDEDGTFVGSAGVIREITERKARQRELRELTRTIERLYDVAKRLHGCSTAREVYELTVDAAVDILGFDYCIVAVPKEGHFELAAVGGDAPDPVEAGARLLEVDEGVAGEVFRTGESRIVDDGMADETSRPVHESFRSNLTLPLGDRGVVQGAADTTHFFDADDLELAELLVAHVREALSRIDREAELQRQNERLEEFASVLSHDVRTPLEVAQGYLELAADDIDPECYDRIARAHDRIERLTDDLLTLARQGQRIERTEPVALADAAREAWTTVDTAAATLQTTDVRIEADRKRLLQALQNLFENAVEHGGPDVTVRVGPLEDATGFSVADDGPGVPPEDRESVFERGYTTASDGTGFGLAIVREIATAHGWTVAVDGSDEGGARFTFRGVEHHEE